MIDFPRKHTAKPTGNEKFAFILQRVQNMESAFMRMADVHNNNFKVMAMLLASLEVLKEKGLYTDAEVKIKFEELQATREANAKSALEVERARLVAEKEGMSDESPRSAQGGSLQSEDTGDNENHSGCSGLTVLPPESAGGDSGGPSNQGQPSSN